MHVCIHHGIITTLARFSGGQLIYNSEYPTAGHVWNAIPAVFKASSLQSKSKDFSADLLRTLSIFSAVPHIPFLFLHPLKLQHFMNIKKKKKKKNTVGVFFGVRIDPFLN